MVPHRVCALLLMTGLLCGIAQMALATSIVIVRDAAQVALAADSEETFEGDGLPSSERSVCKIFRIANNSIFAVAGLADDLTTHFSPADVVAKALTSSAAPQDRLQDASKSLDAALIAELPYLKESDAEGYNKIMHEERAVSILLATVDGAALYAAEFSLNVLATDEGKIRSKITTDDHDTILFAGQIDEIKRHVSDVVAKRDLIASAVARDLVQLEIDARAPGVGGPIDVVGLSRDGVHSFTTKPGCPIDKGAASK